MPVSYLHTLYGRCICQKTDTLGMLREFGCSPNTDILIIMGMDANVGLQEKHFVSYEHDDYSNGWHVMGEEINKRTVSKMRISIDIMSIAVNLQLRHFNTWAKKLYIQKHRQGNETWTLRRTGKKIKVYEATNPLFINECSHGRGGVGNANTKTRDVRGKFKISW